MNEAADKEYALFVKQNGQIKCGMKLDKKTGKKFWLPQCMGGAVYGKKGCTCYARDSRDENKFWGI